MSQANVEFEMQNTRWPTPSAIPVRTILVADGTYGVLGVCGYIKSDTDVSLALTASGGYAGWFEKGCTMNDLENGKLFKNVGTSAAPSFTEISS